MTVEPQYPVGTPEYDEYAANLRAELAKFAAGESPYEYPCPRCTYGEPARHTCDAGQRARYHVEHGGRQ